MYSASGGSHFKLLATAFFLALVISIATTGATGAWAIGDIKEDHEHDEEHSSDVIDSRDDDSLDLLPEQNQAIQSLEGARVEVDSRFGTPRKIVPRSGYLSAAASGDAEDVARNWISENLDLLGIPDAQSLTVVRNHELPETGTRIITFQQTADDLQTVFGGRIIIAVKSDGRILSYAGNPTRSGSLTGEFTLSEAEALSAAVEEVGGITDFVPEEITQAADIAEGRYYGPTTESNGIEYRNFERGQFVVPPNVARVIFPRGEELVPAFRVLFVEDLEEGYDVVVSATDGEILYKRNLHAHQAQPEASGSVYRNYPDAEKGGELEEVSFAGDEDSSSCGWLDVNPLCQTTGQVDSTTTLGNNADTHANWESFITPNPAGARPVDSDNNPLNGTQFDFPYENFWAQNNGQEPSYEFDLNPAATSLFWHHNRIHDEYYELGFTESAGNFQVNNFDNGGSGGDPIQGLVQAGAASGGEPTFTGRNNAYMLTMPDGLPSWSGMFLWEPIPAVFESPFVDGDFDASVIQHEYTHGLTTRYVAGGEALGSHQSGSMGEGWSDWYALDYLYRNRLESEAVVGKYVTGNDGRGIRNWDYDENPLTYADIGYDITGPGVHADGELWAATLWDLRKALVARFGEDRGGEIARRLVTDAQPLTAPDPSYLDARDGILIAGEDRYRGIYNDLIWQVFARRGMGNSASTDGGDDTDPTPGFDHPNTSRNGNLIGKVTNIGTGKPVAGARIFVGRFEARATPFTRTGSQGGFGTKILAGTYPITIQAPGYGTRTVNDVRIPAGGSRKINVAIAPNLVSLRNGAKVVNVSSQDEDNPARNFFDDTEASVWKTEEGADGESFDSASVTTKLKGLSRIKAFRVNAFKNIAEPRFAAMKDWKLETSTDGKKWTLRKRGAFRTDAPRPVTPELQRRYFKFQTPFEARFIRFTMESTQDDSLGFAMGAELQAHAGASEKVTPLVTESDRPVTDTGTIQTGNAATGDPGGLGRDSLGATGTAYQAQCGTDPDELEEQGADGWVTVLPGTFGDGNHVVSVKGANPQDQDLDLYFLNSRCEVVGSQATPSANESGVLPGGSRYVVTVLYTGQDEDFTLTARTAP